MKRFVMALVVVVALGGAALASLGGDDNQAEQQDVVSATTPDTAFAVIQLDEFSPEAIVLHPDGSLGVAISTTVKDFTPQVHTNFTDLSVEPQLGQATDVLSHSPNPEVLARRAPGEPWALC